MSDALFPWHPYRKTLVFSFVFAVCFHAAFFVFLHHLPDFGKIKHVSPPKLKVRLCVPSPVKTSLDVRQVRPSRFCPEVPPPPEKVVPKKQKKVPKPKVVKKPPKKAIRHVEKKVVPPPASPPKPAPKTEKPVETWAEQVVKSAAPTTYTPHVAAPSAAKPTEASLVPGPPPPPKRELAYPDYEKSPALTYPPLAQRRGIEGRVVLKVLVGKTGHPLKVVLERSSGSSILDKSAMKAVRNWVFKPGKLNGTAVEMWVRVPVVYALK